MAAGDNTKLEQEILKGALALGMTTSSSDPRITAVIAALNTGATRDSRDRIGAACTSL